MTIIREWMGRGWTLTRICNRCRAELEDFEAGGGISEFCRACTFARCHERGVA